MLHKLNSVCGNISKLFRENDMKRTDRKYKKCPDLTTTHRRIQSQTWEKIEYGESYILDSTYEIDTYGNSRRE